PSPTFHGRDVFAPVVAHLANGVEPARVGRELDWLDLVRLPEPFVTGGAGELTAEGVTLDRFGNVQLAAMDCDIESAALRLAQPVAVMVNLEGSKPIAEAAGGVPAPQPTARTSASEPAAGGVPAWPPAGGASVGQPASGAPVQRS